MFPETASLQCFSHNPTNIEQRVLAGRMEIRATNFVEKISVSSFRPQITGSVMVSDMRTISEKTPLGVAVEATNWPDLAASRTTAAAIISSRALALEQSRSGNRRVRTLILMVLAAPFVLVLLGKLKGKQQSPTNKHEEQA
jgi:hypothetical protein